MLAYEFITTGNATGTIMGIVVGHMYYFGKAVLARRNPSLMRYFEAPRLLRQFVRSPGLPKPGETVTKAAGYTVHAPVNPIRKPGQEEDNKPKFKPFSGPAKKLGTD